MAKIKDLGINVIPETMRPPEVGPGGCRNTFPQVDDACCPATCYPTTGFRNLWGCCPVTCQWTTFVDGCCPDTCYPTTARQGVMFTGQPCIRDWIGQLKEQFQQQIAQLEEYEKTMGPRTAEEIDAREKALKAELAELAARRKDLKGK